MSARNGSAATRRETFSKPGSGLQLTPLRAAVSAACRLDERTLVEELLAQQPPADPTREPARALARRLAQNMRRQSRHAGGVDALMQQFSLSSEEGVALMCLAEALLRIPDNATRDRLIADKIGRAHWSSHVGASSSLFVNAAAWGLLITGRLVSTHSESGLRAVLARLLARSGEPVVRAAVDLAMRLLGRHFVCGETIAQALSNSRDYEARGYRHSFDMLGEAALTADDAQRYFGAYRNAIDAIGAIAGGRGPRAGPGISVKLSALHPRYAHAQRERVLAELLPRLRELALLARRHDIGLNIDAEEAERLELSMELLEGLATDPALRQFEGLGFVIQAYQKRCPALIDWLADLARRTGHRFMLRLVKGAYWDAEIKRAQVDGMPGYPVFTRKAHTDVCYLVCARKLLAHGDLFYPQFATHNAHTLATIHCWALDMGVDDFEFQCLYGMGDGLYDQVVDGSALAPGRACRIYAPVGSHQTLLAYLVRRLLENGANSSFVNRLANPSLPLEELIADPFDDARATGAAPHPAIPLPVDLYRGERRNSLGIDLCSEIELAKLGAALRPWSEKRWTAGMLHAGMEPQRFPTSSPRLARNPADHDDIVAEISDAEPQQVAAALETAKAAQATWATRSASERAAILRAAADLLQQHMHELIAMTVREAGRTVPAAIGEVREATDFLRYYAVQCETLGQRQALGTVVCISPWNFPLAIFVGQVSAALAAGNVVLAKPAEQTSAIAYRAVQLLHQAGVPSDALQLLPGSGETVGAALVESGLADGVLFTGSTAVAARIQSALLRRAANERRAIPLIAETGGLNVMLVDSSALPEQVVQDALVSAFDSAGQRCSALRVLCLQEEIADRVLEMLRGALQQWRLGKPDRLDTDVGPIIDADAASRLHAHLEQMRDEQMPVWQLPLPDDLPPGSWFAPTIIEIDRFDRVRNEVFGPVLHVLRYRREELPRLLDAVAASGYGLTIGIQTRIDDTTETVIRSARVGNVYVNRNMIGAVVGVQPFGGIGKSGTGPKAGGPHYLQRLVRQQSDDCSSCRPDAREGSDRADIGLPQTMLLPGPTGESNRLAWRPRGAVLCISDDAALLARMIRLVRVTGNRPLVLAGAGSGQSDSDEENGGDPVGSIDRIVGPPEVAAILADRPALQRLSEADFSDGAPLVLPVLDGVLPPRWLLYAEQTVTVNTTAAGGNATLMTL